MTNVSFLVAGGIESHVDTRNSEEHLMNDVFIHNMKETKRGRISQDISHSGNELVQRNILQMAHILQSRTGRVLNEKDFKQLQLKSEDWCETTNIARNHCHWHTDYRQCCELCHVCHKKTSKDRIRVFAVLLAKTSITIITESFFNTA